MLRPIMSETSKTAKIILVLYCAMDLIWLLLYLRPQYSTKMNVEFTSGLHFDIFSRLGRQNASAYQISCKSVNISRNYDVSYIFKMASVRHLEFWKIQILDKFSRAESKSASAHKIRSKSDDQQPRYCEFAIKLKSNLAAAAMLNLLPVYYLTHFKDNVARCISVRNFMQIGPYLAKL